MPDETRKKRGFADLGKGIDTPGESSDAQTQGTA
jgi:hypothetical protein